MAAQHAPMNPRPFPSTMWTEIERAQGADDEHALQALESVLCRYYAPLRRYLVTQFRVGEEQARDWLQSFVWKKVLLQHLFDRAKRGRGKFRTFLLNALEHFVLDEIKRQGRQCRQPEGGFVPLDPGEKEPRLTTVRGPGNAFDVAWAQGVLQETLAQMEAECAANQRQHIWKVFQIRLLRPVMDGKSPLPYRDFCQQLGFKSDAEAGNALTTAKRMFQRVIRSVIGAYAVSENEIDREIRELLAVLSDAGQ